MKNVTLLLAVIVCLFFTSCVEDPTCFDGIQNQGETDIDCGGADCQPCSNLGCSDGVMNGDETGIDCGGSCDPCSGGCPSSLLDSFSYEVGGTSNSADIVSTNLIGGNLSIQVNTQVPVKLLSLTHDGASFMPGDYNVGGLTRLYYEDGGETYDSILSGSSGTVSFTEFSTDSACPYVTGTIDATLFSAQGSSVQVTGSFTQLEY